MSESTSAPPSSTPSPAATSTPAPNAAPTAPSSDPGVSPPANDKPPISVSEAARLLSRQRRETAPPPPPAATTPDRRPPAAELAKTASPTAPTPPTPPTPAPSPLSAMEKALGVPPTAPPSQESTPQTPSTPQNALSALEIDGKHYSQTELREAVLKSADYTRKTQELAQQRQQLEAQQRALAEVLPHIQPELLRLQEMVQNPPQPPDPSLIETNQQQYLRERAQYEHALAEQQRLFSLNNLQSAAQQRALEQQVAVANEQLAKELPFWADPQQRLEAQQQIVEWATSKGGFSRDELRGLASPHHLKTMMKAAMFDRWVEGAKTSAPPSSSAPARGVAPPPAPSERIAAATEAFQARPDARSGAALIAARRAAMNGGAR